MEEKAICKRCDKEFSFIRKTKRQIKNYCSTSCKNKKKFTREQNLKKGRKGKDNSNWKGGRKPIQCKKCSIPIRRRKNGTGYCRACYDSLRTCKDDYRKYRKLCKFKFNLTDYLNIFDFSLIEEYGWYKPANKGNNLNGVSRDHIISVKYGYENNISPEIISHPANCQLLRHNDNVSKGKQSEMTIDELLEKIKCWPPV